MTCSHSNCVPKARTPSTWVTVLASQPSVSIETETTQRMELAQAPGLADGVHHLAQQVLVGDVVARARVAGALDDLAAEALDLVGGHGAEVVVQRLAGFELLAVDQQGARAAERVAVLVEVAEQGQSGRGRASRAWCHSRSAGR